MDLISVHVPKTAGVSFRTLLRDVYGPSALFLDYGDRALDPQSTFQADPARWRTETEQQVRALTFAVRVIHGHFNGAKYDRAFPAARKVVWLRDPVSRLVSHYHYWRDLPPSPHALHRRLLDGKLSLLEFARLEGMRDVLARVFLRDCRLEDFAFVGIQERFASDLRALGALLGWPSDLTAGEENRNTHADYTASLNAAEREEIAALNRDDMLLYQQALSRQRP